MRVGLTLYKFNAKELDNETGLYYYGARYFTPEWSVWLSVDPLSDKYPSTSAYMYTLSNPIKFIDPNGMEVDYNSNLDRFYTGMMRIFNSDFRAKFKDLKKSEETYVFNHNREGNNSFTTDGDKLFINYSSTNDSKEEGHNNFRLLMHETTHGIQFEYGKIGFKAFDGIICGNGDFWANKWTAINRDVFDEIEAHNAMNKGSFMLTPLKSNNDLKMRAKWPTLSRQEKVSSMQLTYPDISSTRENNSSEKIKNQYMFTMPFGQR